jgi:hypothetical protein
LSTSTYWAKMISQIHFNKPIKQSFNNLCPKSNVQYASGDALTSLQWTDWSIYIEKENFDFGVALHTKT